MPHVTLEWPLCVFWVQNIELVEHIACSLQVYLMFRLTHQCYHCTHEILSRMHRGGIKNCQTNYETIPRVLFYHITSPKKNIENCDFIRRRIFPPGRFTLSSCNNSTSVRVRIFIRCCKILHFWPLRQVKRPHNRPLLFLWFQSQSVVAQNYRLAGNLYNRNFFNNNII